MMKRLRPTLNILLLLLAGPVAMTTMPAQAASYSFCQGKGDTTLHLPNINFKAGSLPGPGQILYTSPPYTISYECSTEPSPSYRYAPTLQKLGDFQSAVNALNGAGLALNIIIQEAGQPEVVWTWDRLQYQSTLAFGARMASNSDNIARSATVKLQLVVRRTIYSAQIVQVSSLSAFSIIPSPSHTGAPSAKINSTAFAIRYLPDNFGTVSVSPSVVSVGHIFTDYPTGPRRTPFTVTAAQRAGVGGPNGNFTLPLNVTFTVSGKALTDAGQAIVLTTDDGQPNGLKLSLLDGDPGSRLTFGQSSRLGTLVSGAPGTLPPPARKTYTALLEQIPGQPLKTGPFRADVVATVTYD